jgi:molecular chaperone DnaJ
MAARDYYKVLGVPRKATQREIKAAYRRLARKYHPDVTGEDDHATERFKEITEAYETLSDPKRRRAYDLFGTAKDDTGPFDGFADGVSGFADLFGDFFRGGDPTKPAPGVDVEVDLEVTFQEAFDGAQKVVEAELLRPCSECEGRGAPKDVKPGPCDECDGTGKVGAAGPLPFKRACPRCDGRGRVYPKKCKACRGKGSRQEKERLKVTVPPGVDDGSRLRLKKRGAAGHNGGPPGDLYVRVSVADDERFERDGEDVHTQVRVPVSVALLGGHAEVDTPTGRARLTVPAGTQGGQVFRLRDKGFAALGGKRRGDLYVTVQLSVPRLDDSQRRQVEELRDVVSDF